MSDETAIAPVETRVLSQSVRRNPDRFPEDFMFELGWEEWTELKRPQEKD